MSKVRLIFLALALPFLCGAQDISNEWSAQDYVQANNLQHLWADAFFFDDYHFEGNESVLDIGCGDGTLTHRIASKTSGKVTGIDSSMSMIEYAKSTSRSEQEEFKHYSAEESSIYQQLAASCDLVVSFHCLHWVEDHHAVLDGIMTALKPGGRAFLRFCSDGFDPIQELANEMILSKRWSGHFEGFVDPIHRFGVEQYRQLLDAHGFEIIQLQEFVGADHLKGRSELYGHVKGWLPHYKFLGEKLGSLFLNELVDTHLEQYPMGDLIELPDCYLEVAIRKKSVSDEG